MKTVLTYLLLFISTSSSSQVLYDFSTNPFLNGWFYYDTFGSSPNAEFSYNALYQRIDYNIFTSTDISIFHRQLPFALTTDYNVSFQITPTSTLNYNTFFPLILTPYEITSPGFHPWRENAISQVQAGGMQNLDFLAMEILSNEVRLFSRNDDIISPNLIQSLNPPFYLQVNQSYWIALIISNSINAEVKISSDANFNTILASSTFVIPMLDSMNHIYIANSNGNTGCVQQGFLDDYKVISGPTVNLVEIKDTPKELVKVIDVMGIESTFQKNKILIYIYSDGSTKRVIEFD